MATYVISDIHGRLDVFQSMLETVEFSDEDIMVIAGDCIDRGPQSIELIDFIKTKKNMEYLMGNHEWLLLREMRQLDKHYISERKSIWIRNGGYDTYHQISKREERDPGYKQRLVKYMSELKYEKVININERTFIIIHGGYRINTEHGEEVHKILENTSNEDKVWLREEFYKNRAIPGHMTIFGHTPTCSIDKNIYGKIWHDKVYTDKIGIDCGVYRTSILGCIRLDDMKEFYVQGKKIWCI